MRTGSGPGPRASASVLVLIGRPPSVALEPPWTVRTALVPGEAPRVGFARARLGTMRALRKTSRGPGAGLEDVPVPEPGEGEVLVRVHAASICGTDLHIFDWNEWAEGRGPACR